MANQPRFPFEKLPSVIQLDVLQRLDFQEIFFLSLCSPQCQLIVRNAPFKVQSLTVDLKVGKMDVNVSFPNRKLRICMLSQEVYSEHIRIVESFPRSLMFKDQDQNKEERKLYGMFWQRGIRVRQRSMRKKEPEPAESYVLTIITSRNQPFNLSLIHNVMDHLYTIFKVYQCQVFADDISREILGRFLFRYKSLVYFNLLYLHFDTKAILTSEDLSKILDLRVGKLELKHGEFSDNFRIHKGLQAKMVRVSNGSWLTIENLLNMKSEMVRAKGVRIQEHEFKLFIKKWMEGGFEKLRQVRLSPMLDLPELFYGIPGVATNEDWSKTIKRADGKVANVAFYFNTLVLRVL